MILRPDGAPARKRRVPMTRVDVQIVTEFERWCRLNKLSLDLYCDKCANEHGPRGARMWANNSRDATAYHLECRCTDRVYGQDSGLPRETPKLVDPKIQVVVP